MKQSECIVFSAFSNQGHPFGILAKWAKRANFYMSTTFIKSMVYTSPTQGENEPNGPWKQMHGTQQIGAEDIGLTRRLPTWLIFD
jgi:hypothetical protein